MLNYIFYFCIVLGLFTLGFSYRYAKKEHIFETYGKESKRKPVLETKLSNAKDNLYNTEVLEDQTEILEREEEETEILLEKTEIIFNEEEGDF